MAGAGDASKALFGRRILVTRAAGQASELADQLRLAGATPVLIPVIEIAPPASFAGLDSALRALDGFDVVAFTSANAVEAFAKRAKELSLNAAPHRVAVVGSATARAAQAVGLTADDMPEKFTAESLAEKLEPDAEGQRFLLVLAEDAPTTLRDRLEAAGAKVTVTAGYRNRVPAGSIEAVRQLFGTRLPYPDAVTFTSASTATNLIGLLEEAKLKLPSEVVRASIGPITSRVLSALGLPPHVEAHQSTIASLVEALVVYFARVR